MLNSQQNSDDPVLAVCTEIQQNPKMSFAVLQNRFDDIEDFTDRERALVHTWVAWYGHRTKTRKQLTPIQTLLIHTAFNLLPILEQRLGISPETDLLASIIDVWYTLEDDCTCA